MLGGIFVYGYGKRVAYTVSVRKRLLNFFYNMHLHQNNYNNITCLADEKYIICVVFILSIILKL